MTLHAKGWSSGRVDLARTFTDRLLGLRRSEAGAVLLRARSVHGLGLSQPFLAVGLTSDLRVKKVRDVFPGQFARFPGCALVLELPMGATPPFPGWTLEMQVG